LEIKFMIRQCVKCQNQLDYEIDPHGKMIRRCNCGTEKVSWRKVPLQILFRIATGLHTRDPNPETESE